MSLIQFGKGFTPVEKQVYPQSWVEGVHLSLLHCLFSACNHHKYKWSLHFSPQPLWFNPRKKQVLSPQAFQYTFFCREQGTWLSKNICLYLQSVALLASKTITAVVVGPTDFHVSEGLQVKQISISSLQALLC